MACSSSSEPSAAPKRRCLACLSRTPCGVTSFDTVPMTGRPDSCFQRLGLVEGRPQAVDKQRSPGAGEQRRDDGHQRQVQAIGEHRRFRRARRLDDPELGIVRPAVQPGAQRGRLAPRHHRVVVLADHLVVAVQLRQFGLDLRPLAAGAANLVELGLVHRQLRAQRRHLAPRPRRATRAASDRPGWWLPCLACRVRGLRPPCAAFLRPRVAQ